MKKWRVLLVLLAAALIVVPNLMLGGVAGGFCTWAAPGCLCNGNTCLNDSACENTKDADCSVNPLLQCVCQSTDVAVEQE